MDASNRRIQMGLLCRWLMPDFKSQSQMAQAIGVPQSMISGYMSGKKNAAIPQDDTKQLFASYLSKSAPKDKLCAKWDVTEFTRYLDSDISPQVFTSMLRDKPVTTRMSVREIASSLTEVERLELVEIVVHDLKKNRFLSAA